LVLRSRDGFFIGAGVMPMDRRQAEGLAVLAVIAVLFYALKLLSPSLWPLSTSAAPSTEEDRTTKAVALNREGREEGIFFLPADATIADLLLAAGFPNTPLIGRIAARGLRAGDKVYLASAGAVPVIGKMNAAELLALNLPVDINRADFEELVLVPGIGKKTAALIIALRERKKGFSSLRELEEIKGIKEKKLAGLQKYLCVLP